MEVDDVLREKLQSAHIWHLATAGPGGRPHVSVVWADMRGEHILVNSALGRIKPRNIAGNPLVALSWCDPLDENHSFAIQGQVVETIVGEQAEADCDFLAQKYLDQPLYPWRADGERRVTFLIEPSRIHRQPG